MVVNERECSDKSTSMISTHVSKIGSEIAKAIMGPMKTETCQNAKHIGICFSFNVSRNIAGGKANNGIVPTPEINWPIKISAR